jgi:hypothetical protein
MSTFHGRVSIINKFCEYFKGSFSKNQFAAFTAILYGLINEYKRVNISSLAHLLLRKLFNWIRQNGYLYRAIATGQKDMVCLPLGKAIAKATSLKGKSMNECKQTLLNLVLFSSYQALRKNDLIPLRH